MSEALLVVSFGGPEGPDDVAPLGARLRAALGAKGGGKARTFQGTGGTVPAGLDLHAVLSEG